jgi:hypothetical protein
VGVVHLLPTGNSSFTAKIKLSALRCRQKVIQDHGCKFELNAAHDKVKVATASANELEFSFQTDKPTSGLLRLQGKNADLTVRIEGMCIRLQFVLFSMFRRLPDQQQRSFLSDSRFSRWQLPQRQPELQDSNFAH